jgi:alpha-L-rhamnosidase
MLENGATTIWEHWEFSDNTFSHNHPMFGSVSEWFYKSLAGIQPDPSGPGFKKFFVRPSVVGDLTWVKAHHDSMYGRIESSWKREGNKLTLTVVVPPNTSATVFVPGTSVTESGKAMKSKVEVGSGTFVFTSILE